MHFAPQWVKPIKPSGTATTPTAESPTTLKPTTNIAHNIPFPALSSSGNSHPSSNAANPGLSYSRATHTPTTSGFPADSSYFPYNEPNGHGNDHKPHPFRYSRDQILSLWDEEKVRNTPIELVDLGDGGVLVSKTAIKPIGLRELTDQEKKLLNTSVHPPNPTRRQNTAPTADPNLSASQMSRRTIGTTAGKEVSTPTRGSAFGAFGAQGGAFGTGKIGAIGGGMLSPGVPTSEGKAPGALGGGFGGVGRRTLRRTESGGDPGAWRTTRTASGNFEGVLGFGGAAPQQERIVSGGAADAAAPQSPWKEKDEEQPKTYGSGGGPGWGTGQKKWRIAAGLNPAREEKTFEVPITNEKSTESVAATAPGTPLPERDAQVESADAAENAPPAQEKEDLGAIEWFYRDPGGQEQGPFTGSQMHEWYSHAYFTDDLPLRRAAETTFQTLADLKSATGNAVQPFLSSVRVRLPPNLPIPLAAAQPGPVNGMVDSLRNLGLGNPSPVVTPSQQAPYNQFMPDRSAIPQQHFAPQNVFVNSLPNPAAPFMPSANSWGAPQPRMNSFGSVGMPSPIGSAALYPQQPQNIYSPVIGGHVQQQRDFFSPINAHPGMPWGAPQPHQFAPPQQAWQPAPEPQNQGQSQPLPAQSIELAPPIEEPSYFPPNELAQPAQPEPQQEVEETPAQEAVEGESGEKELQSEEPEPVLETPEAVEETPAPAPAPAPEPKPPVSVWGQKASTVSTPAPSAPASRKSSFAQPAPAMTPAKATPTPAAAPPKPAPEPIEIAATPEKPVISSRPAPWAEGRTPSTAGPSLREIQEAEAKEAEAKKAARVAAASPAPVSTSDDLPANLTWGLPTSQKAAAPVTPAVSTPAAPAWGGGDAAPKKTLKQIQEEEEKRKTKAAQAAKAAQIAAGPASTGPKRGYADLAATSQPPGAGWTTVGAPKAASAAAAPAARPASAVVSKPAAVAAKPATPAAVKPKVDESAGPSVEFIRWTKQSLTGLNVNVDEFIQMLLTFPIDPPAADRPGILEVISDSVYANSSTLDGRRFAQEFFTRRKADAARPKGSAGSVGKTSLADVVKSIPKKVEDAGFRVVKAKGKKKN